ILGFGSAWLHRLHIDCAPAHGGGSRDGGPAGLAGRTLLSFFFPAGLLPEVEPDDGPRDPCNGAENGDSKVADVSDRLEAPEESDGRYDDNKGNGQDKSKRQPRARALKLLTPGRLTSPYPDQIWALCYLLRLVREDYFL